MDPYRARKLAKVIAIIVAVAMIVTSFSFVMLVPGLFGMGGGASVYAASNEDELDTDMHYLKQYIQYVRNNYKDSVSYDQLVNGAFHGVIDSLDDPYSVYYGATGEGQSFVESVSGEYSGIGLSLENYNGQCRVVAPIPGTPAEKSGIKTGDIVTMVDGKDISSKTLDEAVSMMRGEAGTKVTVTVSRIGREFSVTLIREKIKNVSVFSKMLEDKTGYIQLTSFDADSDDEMKAALESLKKQGMKALVLDVRNNPGGLVNTAVNIAQLLMPAGPVTHFEHQGKIEETYSVDGSAIVKVPM
ncbi:MAG: S41 family peptidase, partial [Eubacteriales bacterium]|nr:S41 family peptidase [Eubacteriales bacterium]